MVRFIDHVYQYHLIYSLFEFCYGTHTINSVDELVLHVVSDHVVFLAPKKNYCIVFET